MTAKIAPDALLLLTSGCPHCPTVLQGLSELVKQGVIAKLEVINISVSPEIADELGVRSIPWTRIGMFELSGLRSMPELRKWAERAASNQGLVEYFDELLSNGQLPVVERMIREKPKRLRALAELTADAQTGIATRIGIGALLEGLQGTGLTDSIITDFAKLLASDNPRIRADAAHFLVLTESRQVIPYLQSLVDDENDEVREIVSEGLEVLRNRNRSIY
jgi:thiol-disulfide isomerase/thioredoxin